MSRLSAASMSLYPFPTATHSTKNIWYQNATFNFKQPKIMKRGLPFFFIYKNCWTKRWQKNKESLTNPRVWGKWHQIQVVASRHHEWAASQLLQQTVYEHCLRHIKYIITYLHNKLNAKQIITWRFNIYHALSYIQQTTCNMRSKMQIQIYMKHWRLFLPNIVAHLLQMKIVTKVTIHYP